MLRQRPLPNEATRQALTRAYLAAHLPPGHPHPPDQVHMLPRAVCLHWTGGPTADSAFATFAPARLAGRPELVGAGALNVAAHFLVHRDGRVDQLAPETRILRHVIGLNHCAIGVENVGDGPLGGPGRAPLTEAQVRANVQLIALLKQRHSTVTAVFGHHEYRRLEGGPLFAERDPSYRTAKRDPGERFMAAVRADLVNRGLSLSTGSPP